MPIFANDDADILNEQTLTGAPAVRITGNRVTFTNGESGRVISTTLDRPAIAIEGSGTVIINRSGGVIRSSSDQPYIDQPVVITGTAGTDRVENAGTIIGTVALFGGDDVFVSRVTDNMIDTKVDLGSGNDSFYVRGTSGLVGSNGGTTGVSLVPHVDGGDGTDRLIVFENDGNIDGPLVSNVEILDLRVNGFIESFRGLDRVEVNFNDASRTFNALRFFDTPDAAVVINAAAAVRLTSLAVYDRSTIGSLTGSGAGDHVNLGSDTVIAGAVRLGAGDDTLTISRSQFEAPRQERFGSSLDGGIGMDRLSIQIQGGDRIDISNATGFELLNIGNFQDGGTVTVSGANAFADVTIAQRTSVILSASDLSADVLRVEGGASLVIAADSRIGRIVTPGSQSQGTFADDTQSVRIVNYGTIDAAIVLGIGDDSFDGRRGTAVASVTGGAGNDTILTDLGNDRLFGGAGADVLDSGSGIDLLVGGGAADRLTGGAGADTFRGTAAELAGDVVTDFQTGDRLHVTDIAYADFAYTRNATSLTVAGSTLTLPGTINTRLVVHAAAEGGTELALANRYTNLNDFNGDGHSDLLWQNANGSISTWNVSGNVVGNQLAQNSYFASVPASWNVVETFDMGGDGRSDILWRNENGAVSVWTASGSGFATGTYNAQVGSEWKIAGTGDLNGDGKDDLLWRRDDGAISSWQSTGTSFQQNAYAHASVGASWKVAGLADFDGDGKDDLLWRNDNGALSEWQATGAGFAESVYNDTVGTEWKIVGLGDFNGDGRDDILWRNASGAISEWQSTGAGFARNTYFDSSVGNSWQVAQIGDFNDDGRADILWHNTGGAISIWQSNGQAFDQNVLYNPGADPSWQIQAHEVLL